MSSPPGHAGKDFRCPLAVLDGVSSRTHDHRASNQWFYAAAYSCRLLYKTFRVYAFPSLVTPVPSPTVSRHTRNGIIRALTDPNEYPALLAAGTHSAHTVLRHFLQQSHQHITQTTSKKSHSPGVL